MEQTVHSTETYDFRKYDRIWQRVAPNLEPYLDAPGVASPASSPSSPAAAEPAGTAPQPLGAGLARQESQLPGADANPCCMGSTAAEMLDVITGYIEEELADQRYTKALLRQAPSWARQRLRDIAAGQGDHAHRLMAAYYLIQGTCYRPSVSTERIYVGRWCPALRERYHAAACNGLNYARSAGDTMDPCLSRIFQSLSDSSYVYADQFMQMLERSLQG